MELKKTTILFIRVTPKCKGMCESASPKLVIQLAAGQLSGRIANRGLFCQAKRLPVHTGNVGSLVAVANV
jgi:hypothetical protein